MIPFGFIAFTSSAETRWLNNSEKTPKSRMRRVINWLYWLP